MKQEAKVVYLLECLQKTSPPVGRCLCLIDRRFSWKKGTVNKNLNYQILETNKQTVNSAPHTLL